MSLVFGVLAPAKTGSFCTQTLKGTISDCLQRKTTLVKVIRKLLSYSVVEIYPPHICTHGPGEDPFEAVMCAVGAASQISLLMEDAIFNTKTSLVISAGSI